MSHKEIHFQTVQKSIQYLLDHYTAQPSLDVMASSLAMSPHHFQKIFTDWVGISPKKFLSYLILNHLKAKIKQTQNMMEAADCVGLSSQSRVHDLFVKIEGVSPYQYKTEGKHMEIRYGYHPSPFGTCFLAASQKGICGLRFIDQEMKQHEFGLFLSEWGEANLIHDPEYTKKYVASIFYGDSIGEDLKLLVRGTDFQIKVWDALVNIPYGSVASFNQVANSIGHPLSSRSVASAVSANPILFLIPCHRIITKKGTLGNYHKGKARKMAMIGWEHHNMTKGTSMEKLLKK